MSSIVPRASVVNVGKALKKTPEERNDGGDLRLLQHHFSEPDAVRVARCCHGRSCRPWTVCQAIISSRINGIGAAED